MKEKWEKMKQQAISLWTSSSKVQKTVFFSVASIFLVLIIVITFVTSTTKFVPLYSNLSVQEVGQIKEELDTRNTPYEIQEGGTAIHVPEELSEQLLVELAGQGIPNSGNIDYSFFSENTSWGVTDNEFNMIKLDAMQTELANLIKGIEGIEEAKVMINLPEETVFVSDQQEKATASIVIHTNIGHEFKHQQIDSLYHLVSKAVPNLPEENIVITNQYFEYYDRSQTADGGIVNEYSEQQTIKKEIERDIQKRLQQMIGAMVGMDKVVVSVTADLDFTNEKRVEELVEPVDVDNMEGIPVSIETIKETFEGNQAAGGIVGPGEEEVPNYPAEATGENGDYESTKDTINYELNRIHKEIAETPYKVRDLGIQVAIDNIQTKDGDEVQLLSQQEQNTVEEGISSILNSMVSTSIDKEYGEIDPEEKISIVFQSFHGRESMPETKTTGLPIWVYIAGGALLLVVILLLIILLRRNSKQSMEEEAVDIQEEPVIPDLNEPVKSERDIQMEQLERMAKQNPKDFAKLLRSWISED